MRRFGDARALLVLALFAACGGRSRSSGPPDGGEAAAGFDADVDVASQAGPPGWVAPADGGFCRHGTHDCGPFGTCYEKEALCCVGNAIVDGLCVCIPDGLGCAIDEACCTTKPDGLSKCVRLSEYSARCYY